MKATTLTLIASLGLVGTAAADAHKEKAPAAPPAKGAMPAPPAAKGAMPATPATPAAKTTAATPAAPAKAEPPKKAEAPKAPAELAAYAKSVQGTWRCTGQGIDMTNPAGGLVPQKSTMTFKTDLDKWWITGKLTVTGKPGMKGIMYATFDPVTKKWHRTMFDNWGGSQTEWSEGAKDGKLVWLGDARMPMPEMASSKTRTTEIMVGPREVKMTGEWSKDGKTWMTGWEQTCKK